MKILACSIVFYKCNPKTISSQIKRMNTQIKIHPFSHYIKGFRSDGRSFYSLSAVTHLYFILAGSERSRYLTNQKNKFILHNIKFKDIKQIENKKKKKQNSHIQCFSDSILFNIIHYIYVDYGNSIKTVFDKITNARHGHFGIGRNKIQNLRDYYYIENVKTDTDNYIRQQYIMILPMKTEIAKNKSKHEITSFCVPIELIVAKKINAIQFVDIQKMILENPNNILTEKLFSAFIIRFGKNSKLYMLNMMRSPGVTTIGSIFEAACSEISELNNYNFHMTNAKQLYPYSYENFKTFVNKSNYFLIKSKLQDIKDKSHIFKSNIIKINKVKDAICNIESFNIFNFEKKNWTQISRKYISIFLPIYKYYSKNEKTTKYAKYLARFYTDTYFDELDKSNDTNIAKEASNTKIKELFKLLGNQ